MNNLTQKKYFFFLVKDALEILERHAVYVDSGQRDSRALAFRRAACALKSYPKYATLLFTSSIDPYYIQAMQLFLKQKGGLQVVGQKRANLILQILYHLHNNSNFLMWLNVI